PRRVAAARAREQVVESEVLARAAELAAELVAQEDVEAGERGLRGGLHIGFERNHARQLHLQTGTTHRAIVFSNDVHPLEEHRLDGILPGPQRQRVIAERTEIRIENERGPARWR